MDRTASAELRPRPGCSCGSWGGAAAHTGGETHGAETRSWKCNAIGVASKPAIEARYFAQTGGVLIFLEISASTRFLQEIAAQFSHPDVGQLQYPLSYSRHDSAAIGLDQKGERARERERERERDSRKAVSGSRGRGGFCPFFFPFSPPLTCSSTSGLSTGGRDSYLLSSAAIADQDLRQVCALDRAGPPGGLRQECSTR